MHNHVHANASRASPPCVRNYTRKSRSASVIYQDTEAPEVVVGNRFEIPGAVPADANIN